MVAAVSPAMQLTRFHAALARIGFTEEKQDALNAKGFKSMYNLMIYSSEQIKCVCMVLRECPIDPLQISMEQEQFLMAMHHWVKTCVRTNRLIDPDLFTRDVAIQESICMVNIAEGTSTEKESDIKLPEAYHQVDYLCQSSQHIPKSTKRTRQNSTQLCHTYGGTSRPWYHVSY